MGQNAFQHSKVNAWTANVVARPVLGAPFCPAVCQQPLDFFPALQEGALKRLAQFQKPFKYVGECHMLTTRQPRPSSRGGRSPPRPPPW